MPVLHVIKSLTDPLLNLLADDPVRPEIPADFRVSDSSEVFVLQDKETLEPRAVVCVAYTDRVPADILELAWVAELDLTHAIFYTIWSYKPGAGRALIMAASRAIKRARPGISEFVTLSPPTEMARRFHLKNGASEWRRNADTVNYRYQLALESED